MQNTQYMGKNNTTDRTAAFIKFNVIGLNQEWTGKNLWFVPVTHRETRFCLINLNLQHPPVLLFFKRLSVLVYLLNNEIPHNVDRDV